MEDKDLFKDRPAVNEPKKQGIKVSPYKPNRAQRRKQAALKRKGKLIK